MCPLGAGGAHVGDNGRERHLQLLAPSAARFPRRSRSVGRRRRTDARDRGGRVPHRGPRAPGAGAVREAAARRLPERRARAHSRAAPLARSRVRINACAHLLIVDYLQLESTALSSLNTALCERVTSVHTSISKYSLLYFEHSTVKAFSSS